MKFGAFDRADPLFLLDLENARHTRWEKIGQPGIRAIAIRWTAA